MIQKIRWLWKQFNGDNITAFCVGLFRLIKTIDTQLSYFNGLSIESARDAHLSLLAVIRGLARVIIKRTNDAFFYFTTDPEHNNTHGLASMEDRSVGGQFIDINDPAYSSLYIETPAEMYRALLERANLDKMAGNGSLVQICNILSWGGNTHFKIEWYAHGDLGETRTNGDLRIKVLTDSWGSSSLMYRDSVEGVIRNTLAPETIADVEFVASLD